MQSWKRNFEQLFWIENQINKSRPEAKDSRLNIKAYPNPKGNLLTVELTTDEIGEFTIQITDLKGKQIIAEKVTSQTGYIQFQIDFSNYPNAMYQLQIQSPKGYLNSKKLIKI